MRKILFSVLAVFVATPAMADLVTYRNDRFGTTASFPAEAFPIAAPQPLEEDGYAWRSEEGAELFVYGRHNDGSETPASIISWRKANDHVTYAKSGANWAVVSGVAPDGRTFYERYELKGSIIHSMAMRYPASLGVVYDDLVGTIAGSLGGPSS